MINTLKLIEYTFWNVNGVLCLILNVYKEYGIQLVVKTYR